MKLLPMLTESQVRFTVQAQAGSRVFLAGTFNGWNSEQIRLKDNPHGGVFRTTLTLPSGRHEYKFIVNGEWRLDPNCPDWVVNDRGSLNSVITV